MVQTSRGPVLINAQPCPPLETEQQVCRHGNAGEVNRYGERESEWECGGGGERRKGGGDATMEGRMDGSNEAGK